MQASYPKKLSPIHWDPVHISYPVRKFPETGLTSELLSRRWRSIPEVLKEIKAPEYEIRDHSTDYSVTADLTKSQTSVDYGVKPVESTRFNKHTSCLENKYIYPTSRKLSERPPALTAHGTSESRSAYNRPTTSCRLVTDKDQFKHPFTLALDTLTQEPFYKEIEALDTTHEGFEIHLDPYLTTSRLSHRPFTADQLNRSSNSRDILTYYTYSKTPWVRSPKPEVWRLPVSRPKSMYDRAKFKEDFREIRTHNKLHWVPGSFRTETRDNYVQRSSCPESKIYDREDVIRAFYKKAAAHLETNKEHEISTIRQTYSTENSQIGLKKPLCSVLDQYVEKNKRLACKMK